MGDDGTKDAGGRLTAPDGSIRVELDWVEWFNSHWVRSPRVTEVATGQVLLDLWRTDWDAEVSFPRDRAVRLSLRRYRVRGWLETEIDLQQSCYLIEERPDAILRGPLAEMPAALEAAYARAAASLPPPPPIPPARSSARSYAVALMMLIGALSTIAAATYIVEHFRPRPVQHLDEIPPMPPKL